MPSGIGLGVAAGASVGMLAEGFRRLSGSQRHMARIASALRQKVRSIAAYSAFSSVRKLTLGGSSDHSRPSERDTSSRGRRRGILISPTTSVSGDVDTVFASFLFVCLASKRRTTADVNATHVHGPVEALGRGIVADGCRFNDRRTLKYLVILIMLRFAIQTIDISQCRDVDAAHMIGLGTRKLPALPLVERD